MEDDASHLSTTSRLFGSAGVVKLENMEKKASRPLFLSLFDAACAVSACGCLVSLVVYNSPLQVQWKAADAPSSSHGGGSMDLLPSPFATFVSTVLLVLLNAITTAVWLLVAASVETQSVTVAMNKLVSAERVHGHSGRERRRPRRGSVHGQGARGFARGPGGAAVLGVGARLDDACSVYSDFTYQEEDFHTNHDDGQGPGQEAGSVCSSCHGRGVAAGAASTLWAQHQHQVQHQQGQQQGQGQSLFASAYSRGFGPSHADPATGHGPAPYFAPLGFETIPEADTEEEESHLLPMSAPAAPSSSAASAHSAPSSGQHAHAATGPVADPAMVSFRSRLQRGTYIDPSVDTVTGNHNHSNSQGSSGNRGELTSRSALGDLSLSRQPHQQGRSLGSTDHHHHRNGHGHGASPLRRPVRPASGDENGADNSVTSTLETLAKLKRLGEN